MHWECVCVRECARVRQTRETNVVFRLTADIPSCQAQRSHRSRIKGSNLRQSRRSRGTDRELLTLLVTSVACQQVTLSRI